MSEKLPEWERKMDAEIADLQREQATSKTDKCQDAFEAYWDKVDDYQYEDMSEAECAAQRAYAAAWNRRSGDYARLRTAVEQVRDGAKKQIRRHRHSISTAGWHRHYYDALTRILDEDDV